MTSVRVPPQSRALVVAFACFAVVYTAWATIAHHLLGPFASALGDSVLYDGWGLAMFGYALVTTLGPASRGRVGRPWLPLTIGLGGSVLGDLLWDLVDRGILPGSTRSPSLVDLLYLPASIALIWTTAGLVGRYRGAVLGSSLDTFVVAAGPASAVMPWLIHPYLADAGTGSPVPRVLSVFYPACDVLMTAGLLAAMLAMGRLPALRTLTVGFAIGLVADHIYLAQSGAGTYSGGGWLDFMWLTQYFLLAVTTTCDLPGSLPARSRRADAMHLAGLLLCAALCPAVLVARLLLSSDSRLTNVFSAVATLVLISAVSVRLFGLVRENQRTVSRLSCALEDGERLSRDLQHQARHDSITGLPNRQQLASEIDDLDRSPGSRHSVAFIDLDDFKAVNDTYGHDVGDRLLRALAARLQAVSRQDDLIARLGGDEFAVLMPDTDVEEAGEIARRLLDALRVPLELAGSRCVVAATAGVAGITAGQGSPEEALARADLAMYAAKRAGKDGVMVYAEQMRDQVLGDAEIAAELGRAVRSGMITAMFQPIVDLGTGDIRGVEALARWKHNGRMMSPDVFLPIAEQRGLVTTIDLHVLELSLAHLAVWRRSRPTLRVGFNMSADTLGRKDLVPTVLAALHRHRLPGSALVVEITEQAVVRNSDGAARRLEELRAHGVEVALDDFGSGYSSLSYLQRFPIDVIKLDRSFVVEGVVGETVTPLLQMVIDLGGKLGMGVLVEGLETIEQARAVTQAGAMTGQGWLFARAVAPADLPPLLDHSLLPSDLTQPERSRP